MFASKRKRRAIPPDMRAVGGSIAAATRESQHFGAVPDGSYGTTGARRSVTVLTSEAAPSRELLARLASAAYTGALGCVLSLVLFPLAPWLGLQTQSRRR